jgi:hypothetical protein
MTALLAENLTFIKNMNSEIYELIHRGARDKETWQVETAKNGEPILSYSPDVEGTATLMNSRYNPSLEGERWAQSIEQDIRDVEDVILYGVGMGYHLQAFLTRYPDKRLYVYEPHPEALRCLMEYRDLKSIFQAKRLILLGVGGSTRSQVGFLEDVLNLVRGNPVALAIPAYKLRFHHLYQQFLEDINRTVRARAASHHTLKRFQHDWVRNKILNMAHNIQTSSFRGMLGKCQGIPAIVVGSGPSLADEWDNLRRLKDRAILIAAGTSIQALLKQGIEPHLAVSMDPGEFNKRAYLSLDLENVPLLYIPTVHSDILNLNFGMKMHAFTDLDTPTAYLMKLTDDDPVFESTATVSGIAIQAALYMGCTEIYLVGQDFSFPGERLYTEGVEHASERLANYIVQNSTEWIPNMQGGLNRTNHAFNILREGIEQLLSSYSHCSFYNVSRIGAVIRHTRPGSLQSLFEQAKVQSEGSNWFRERLLNNLRPYSEDRIDCILKRVKELRTKSESFQEAFSNLEEHVCKTNVDGLNQRNKLNWLYKFEEIWYPVLHSEAFQRFYGFFLQEELNAMEKKWELIRSERNLDLKVERLVEVVKPLIVSWISISQDIGTRLEQLMERISVK